MPAVTFSVVCLMLAQTGPGSEFEPQAPPLRASRFERSGEQKGPGMKLGEPSLPKGKGHEPKTVIQPSSRRPPVMIEKDEPAEEETELQPAHAPLGVNPRNSAPAHRPAAPAMRLDSNEEEEEKPLALPPRARSARSEQPHATIHASDNTLSGGGALLRRALHDTHEKSLSGQPITLLSAIERAPDRNAQLKVVRAYWLASVGVAEHHFSISEADFLASLPAGRAPHEQAALNAARTAATAHYRQAELAAVATQQDLADLAQVSPTSPLPLPADVPYIGNYRTSIKELFPNRVPPTALRRIDRTLPHLRELIESQAAAVTAAEKSVQALAQAHDASEVNLPVVLNEFDKLRRQRREFLVAVRDYNFSIADYALAVVAPSANRETVVGTLIETSAPKAKSVLVSPRRDVLPVSGELPLGPGEFEPTQAVPADHAPVFRAPVNRDLVPVEPPSLNPNEFRPGR